MRFALVLGGLGGFGWGVLLGLTTSAAWPDIVVHASAGALLLAVLLRWWRGVWIHAWTEAREQQTEAEGASRKATQVPSTPKT